MKLFKFSILCTSLLILSLNNTSAANLKKAPKIVSSINPIHQIAIFITGDYKNNSLLIKPRTSVHNYQLVPSNISNINKADVIFYISDNLESSMPKILNSLETNPKIVKLITTQDLKILKFQSRVGKDSIDNHIWLDPENAVIIAQEITKTLSDIYPKKSSLYNKNLSKFKEDLRDLDKEIKAKLTKIKGRNFMVHHNNIAYFEDSFGIKSKGPIALYHDHDLTMEDVREINKTIKENQVSCILGSSQERSDLSKQIALNHRIRFIKSDIIGINLNKKGNGYVKLMDKFVDDLVKCVGITK